MPLIKRAAKGSPFQHVLRRRALYQLRLNACGLQNQRFGLLRRPAGKLAGGGEADTGRAGRRGALQKFAACEGRHSGP
jgi:hypothetical protein